MLHNYRHHHGGPDGGFSGMMYGLLQANHVEHNERKPARSESGPIHRSFLVGHFQIQHSKPAEQLKQQAIRTLKV